MHFYFFLFYHQQCVSLDLNTNELKNLPEMPIQSYLMKPIAIERYIYIIGGCFESYKKHQTCSR